MKYLTINNMPTENDIWAYRKKVENYKEYYKSANTYLSIMPLVLAILVFILMAVFWAFKNEAGVIVCIIMILLTLVYSRYSENLVVKVAEAFSNTTTEEIKWSEKVIEWYNVISNYLLYEKHNTVSKAVYHFEDTYNTAKLSIFIKAISSSGAYSELFSELKIDICNYEKNTNTDHFVFDFKTGFMVVPCDKEGNIKELTYGSETELSNYSLLTEEEKSTICEICYHNQGNLSQEELDILCEQCFLK